jgi:hypothetical protein
MTKIIELKQKDITAISGGVNCTEWQKICFLFWCWGNSINMYIPFFTN